MLDNIYPNYGITLIEFNLLILIKLALNFYCSTKGVFISLSLSYSPNSYISISLISINLNLKLNSIKFSGFGFYLKSGLVFPWLFGPYIKIYFSLNNLFKN